LHVVLKRAHHADERRFLSGRKITSPPHMFIGAGSNPFAPPYEFRPCGWPRKCRGGAVRADAILLRLPMFNAFHGQGARPGLHEKCSSGGGRAARLGQDGALDPRQRARHPHSRRGDRAAGGARRTRSRKASASELRDARTRDMAAFGLHVMPTARRRLVAEIVQDSGVLAGWQPGGGRRSGEARWPTGMQALGLAGRTDGARTQGGNAREGRADLRDVHNALSKDFHARAKAGS
jgi:hypothetical protein